jgi:hypothetical protein
VRYWHIEAIIIGLLLGISAVALREWLAYSSLPVRITVLAGAGSFICLIQYFLTRIRQSL